jgi:hypothetical protein
MRERENTLHTIIFGREKRRMHPCGEATRDPLRLRYDPTIFRRVASACARREINLGALHSARFAAGADEKSCGTFILSDAEAAVKTPISQQTIG